MQPRKFWGQWQYEDKWWYQHLWIREPVAQAQIWWHCSRLRCTLIACSCTVEAAVTGWPQRCRKAAALSRLDPCASTVHVHLPATDLGAGLLNSEVTTFWLSRHRRTNTPQERMTAAGSFQSINIVEQSVTVTEPDAVAMLKFRQQNPSARHRLHTNNPFYILHDTGREGDREKVHLGLKKIIKKVDLMSNRKDNKCADVQVSLIFLPTWSPKSV